MQTRSKRQPLMEIVSSPEDEHLFRVWLVSGSSDTVPLWGDLRVTRNGIDYIWPRCIDIAFSALVWDIKEYAYTVDSIILTMKVQGVLGTYKFLTKEAKKIFLAVKDLIMLHKELVQLNKRQFGATSETASVEGSDCGYVERELTKKGNIRVFCRVRPLLCDDATAADVPVISYPTSTEGLGRGIDLVKSGQKYHFTFDKVFDHGASQQDVFVDISQLVQSALDGYKVCIFAYGQTGSGKTYTMMGRPETPDQMGLIPRSLDQIFHTIQSLQAQGREYKMQASVLEIYNDTIRDLLSTNQPSGAELTRTKSGVGKQYTIRHDVNGNTNISDLTIIDVCSKGEISSLLEQATRSRSVGKTHMNEQSSRSHLVFTLRISWINENSKQKVQGVLHLIDLAGSARVSSSGATGDRLKETKAINSSLSFLGHVMSALANKEGHVPFRNSKLTHLLQPCLEGDSKTLMFVNVSPVNTSIEESLRSLQFAERVNTCELRARRRQTTAQPS